MAQNLWIAWHVSIIYFTPIGMSNHNLNHLLRDHSILFTDLYVDNYRSFTNESLASVARHYLNDQIQKTKLAQKMLVNNKHDYQMASIMQSTPHTSSLPTSEILTTKETLIYSQLMVELHQIAQTHYSFLYNSHRNEDFHDMSNAQTTNFRRAMLPRPFALSMFKQFAQYFSIYMRRIREQEAHKIHKLEKAFTKIEQVEHKLEHYDQEMEQLDKKMKDLEALLSVWDTKIDEQKTVYKTAVDECRKEEKLIEEMNANLEKLRAAVNIDTHSQVGILFALIV